MTVKMILHHIVAGRPQDRQLDIVLAHYSPHNLPQVLQVWQDIFTMTHVQARNPYLFVYCKNSDVDIKDLDWFAQHGEVRWTRKPCISLAYCQQP